MRERPFPLIDHATDFTHHMRLTIWCPFVWNVKYWSDWCQSKRGGVRLFLYLISSQVTNHNISFDVKDKPCCPSSVFFSFSVGIWPWVWICKSGFVLTSSPYMAHVCSNNFGFTLHAYLHWGHIAVRPSPGNMYRMYGCDGFNLKLDVLR